LVAEKLYQENHKETLSNRGLCILKPKEMNSSSREHVHNQKESKSQITRLNDGDIGKSSRDREMRASVRSLSRRRLPSRSPKRSKSKHKGASRRSKLTQNSHSSEIDQCGKYKSVDNHDRGECRYDDYHSSRGHYHDDNNKRHRKSREAEGGRFS